MIVINNTTIGKTGIKRIYWERINSFKEGFQVNDVHVDLDELIKYCKELRIKIDGKARSGFVAKGGLDE